MPIGFLKRQGDKPLLTSVSRDNPLPVAVYQTQAGNIPTAPSDIDNLLWATDRVPTVAATSSPAHIDLLGNTDGETPTLVNAKDYRLFILTGWHPAPTGNPTSMTLNAALWARSTDPSGAPLHLAGVNVWFKVGDFTLSTRTSAGYFRAVLRVSDGTPLGFDQYRITLNVSFTGGTSPSLGPINAVLRGER